MTHIEYPKKSAKANTLLRYPICSCCHVVFLRPHPENPKWLKCPFCGFCVVAEICATDEGSSQD